MNIALCLSCTDPRLCLVHIGKSSSKIFSSVALMLGGQNLRFQSCLCDIHITYWQEKIYSHFALIYVKFHRSSFAKSSRNSKEQTAVTDFISFLDHYGSHMYFQTILQQVLSFDV